MLNAIKVATINNVSNNKENDSGFSDAPKSHACLQVLALDFHFCNSISVALLSLQTRTASKRKRNKTRFRSANHNSKSIQLTRFPSNYRILIAYDTPPPPPPPSRCILFAPPEARAIILHRFTM